MLRPRDARRTTTSCAADTLAKNAGPGDQIIVLLSGHGTRQPQPEKLAEQYYAEADGMELAFLPEDTGDWNAVGDSVKNALAYSVLP